MSESKPETSYKVPKLPVIVKKGSTLPILKSNIQSNELLLRCLKFGSVCKELVVYKSLEDDFLRGEYPNLTLVNRVNVVKHTSLTIARYLNSSKVQIEKTSREVTKLIGQKAYDIVFSALCSVISQELRIQAILALLTFDRTLKESSSQTGDPPKFTSTSCQTEESCMQMLQTLKLRRRHRKQQFKPYIVRDTPEKPVRIVINPKDVMFKKKPTPTATNINQPKTDPFPDLREIVDEDSNISDTSIGNISLTSQHSINIPGILENPDGFLANIDQHTLQNNIPLKLYDGSVVKVCAKPEDRFHIATREIQKCLTLEERNKLMYQQAYIDWKYCLERDEDGYLPIHHAVQNNDLDLLRRQCVVLKTRNGTVDVAATGNLTALQMTIYQETEDSAALLLEHGADPLLADDEGKTFIHTAAEISPQHLRVALDYCKKNARQILQDDEDQWRPEMETKSDKELATHLLDYIGITCDSQGYTPLMLASKIGNYSSVKLLVEASPDTINRPMPNGGSTALYLAVGAACMDAANSANQTKVADHYMKSIEILVENGADPGLENHSGSSVNILLSEFNIIELSVLIANKLTAIKYFKGTVLAPATYNSVMFVKNSNGDVNMQDIKQRSMAKKVEKSEDKAENKSIGGELKLAIFKPEEPNQGSSRSILVTNLYLTDKGKCAMIKPTIKVNCKNTVKDNVASKKTDDVDKAILRSKPRKKKAGNASKSGSKKDTGDKNKAKTSGDKNNAETSGDKNNATTSGDKNNAKTSGDKNNATTSGDKNNAKTSGDKNNATTSGDKNQAATSGDKNNATTSGDKNNAKPSGDKNNTTTSDEKNNAKTSGDKNNATTSGDKNNAKSSGDVDASISDTAVAGKGKKRKRPKKSVEDATEETKMAKGNVDKTVEGINKLVVELVDNGNDKSEKQYKFHNFNPQVVRWKRFVD